MYEPGYGPATDWRTGEPLVPETSGLFLPDVDRPEPHHMCGRCRNPHTREGNPECPNRKADR